MPRCIYFTAYLKVIKMKYLFSLASTLVHDGVCSKRHVFNFIRYLICAYVK